MQVGCFTNAHLRARAPGPPAAGAEPGREGAGAAAPQTDADRCRPRARQRPGGGGGPRGPPAPLAEVGTRRGPTCDSKAPHHTIKPCCAAGRAAPVAAGAAGRRPPAAGRAARRGGAGGGGLTPSTAEEGARAGEGAFGSAPIRPAGRAQGAPDSSTRGRTPHIPNTTDDTPQERFPIQTTPVQTAPGFEFGSAPWGGTG